MMYEEILLKVMREQGKAMALLLQNKSSTMSGTELNSEAYFIPDFVAAKAQQNMLTRKAGMTDGFVCKSSTGRVVRLLQNYDSDVYTDEPETLPAQWGFVWSKEPAHAQPFIALSTSPYMIGDCCSENGIVYRSTIDSNVWAPSSYPQGWEICEQPKEEEINDEEITEETTEEEITIEETEEDMNE